MQSGHFGNIAKISPGISHSVALKSMLDMDVRRVPFALSVFQMSQQL
jgi:hypothetical protein